MPSSIRKPRLKSEPFVERNPSPKSEPSIIRNPTERSEPLKKEPQGRRVQYVRKRHSTSNPALA